jgi:hypothetical protein
MKMLSRPLGWPEAEASPDCTFVVRGLFSKQQAAEPRNPENVAGQISHQNLLPQKKVSI